MPIPTYDQFIDPPVNRKTSPPAFARKGRRNIAWGFNPRSSRHLKTSRHSKSSPAVIPFAGRADLQRVGGTGDAGIDGVISLDRLGLEKVYIQAKRWSNSVGRPAVQEFYGALAGQRASKGVFITTSTFTQQAVEFVQSVERIVLIDVARLTGLMIEHGVGVRHRVVKVPKVDGDYFVV